MASDMPYRDFARKFRHFGVEIETQKRGSHVNMSKVVGGQKCGYPVPVHNNQVRDWYVRAARKRFCLLPKDGVSDEAFRRA